MRKSILLIIITISVFACQNKEESTDHINKMIAEYNEAGPYGKEGGIYNESIRISDDDVKAYDLFVKIISTEMMMQGDSDLGYLRKTYEDRIESEKQHQKNGKAYPALVKKSMDNVQNNKRLVKDTYRKEDSIQKANALHLDSLKQELNKLGYETKINF